MWDMDALTSLNTELTLDPTRATFTLNLGALENSGVQIYMPTSIDQKLNHSSTHNWSYCDRNF